MHLTCALWLPDVTLAQPEAMAGVVLDDLAPDRGDLTCSVCKQARCALRLGANPINRHTLEIFLYHLFPKGGMHASQSGSRSRTLRHMRAASMPVVLRGTSWLRHWHLHCVCLPLHRLSCFIQRSCKGAFCSASSMPAGRLCRWDG